MSMIRPQPARRMTRRSTSRGGGASGGGFTLIEVLIAIGIFAIGLIAVASIFPVAILLQKQTVQEIEATHFGENARAIVAVRGFVESESVWDAFDNDADVASPTIDGPDVVTPLPAGAMADWSLADRSYNALEPTDERRVFWVPLCYDSDPSGDNAWQVFVFVVRGERDATYDRSSGTYANPSTDPDYVPSVRRMTVDITGGTRLTNFDGNGADSNNPRLIRPGESIVDQDGFVYKVSDADNDGITVDGVIPGSGTINIWYAAPASPGESSTFVKLITLIDSDGADEGDGDIIRSTP